MKQLIYILLLGVILTACKKERTTDIQPVDLTVNVKYPINTSGYTLMHLTELYTLGYLPSQLLTLRLCRSHPNPTNGL